MQGVINSRPATLKRGYWRNTWMHGAFIESCPTITPTNNNMKELGYGNIVLEIFNSSAQVVRC